MGRQNNKKKSHHRKSSSSSSSSSTTAPPPQACKKPKKTGRIWSGISNGAQMCTNAIQSAVQCIPKPPCPTKKEIICAVLGGLSTYCFYEWMKCKKQDTECCVEFCCDEKEEDCFLTSSSSCPSPTSSSKSCSSTSTSSSSSSSGCEKGDSHNIITIINTTDDTATSDQTQANNQTQTSKNQTFVVNNRKDLQRALCGMNPKIRKELEQYLD